jgi:hypothetical protein
VTIVLGQQRQDEVLGRGADQIRRPIQSIYGLFDEQITRPNGRASADVGRPRDKRRAHALRRPLPDPSIAAVFSRGIRHGALRIVRSRWLEGRWSHTDELLFKGASVCLACNPAHEHAQCRILVQKDSSAYLILLRRRTPEHGSPSIPKAGLWLLMGRDPPRSPMYTDLCFGRVHDPTEEKGRGASFDGMRPAKKIALHNLLCCVSCLFLFEYAPIAVIPACVSGVWLTRMRIVYTWSVAFMGGTMSDADHRIKQATHLPAPILLERTTANLGQQMPTQTLPLATTACCLDSSVAQWLRRLLLYERCTS